MHTRRQFAMQEVINRKPVEPCTEKAQVSNYFGKHVFGPDAMREFLSDEGYKAVMEAMEKGVAIDRKVADQVAACMKAWAQSKGVTHYTHWFQPLTGTTAEKHDGFFEP